MSADIVIRGGTVYDGSGGEPFQADVAIEGDRIVEVGKVTPNGARIIDADGLAVSPGFIDGHTHYDAQVFWEPELSPSCYHGITTVVMGNCGFTLAPVEAARPELVVRNLERAEDISPAALAAGIEWRWETVPEYLDTIDSLPKGVNCLAQIGHSALRTWAMREEAFERTATEDELAKMEAQLAEALDAGVVGFTTSRSRIHETSDDRPVASRMADWSEVERLVDVLCQKGRGVFQLAPDYFDGPSELEYQAEINAELKALALDHKIPLIFPVMAAAPSFEGQLQVLDDVVAGGGSATGLTHSRGINIVLSFETQLPFDRLPEWAELRSQPLERQRELLRDPAIRAELVRSAHSGQYRRPSGAEARPPDFSRLAVMDDPIGEMPTVGQIAAERGADPVEVMIDLALETDLHRFFMQPALIEADEDRYTVMSHPHTVMTFSDSGAHVGQIIDSSIQTYFLARWVREKQAFSLAQAVRMLTSTPAAVWRIPDRGWLRPGMVADVNVFDPERIGPGPTSVRYDLPAGARRLWQGAEGIEATLVSGEVTLEAGEHTGVLPGSLIRTAGRHDV